MDYRNIMGTSTNFKTEEDIIPAYLMMWVYDLHPFPTKYYNVESFLSDISYYMKEQAAKNRFPILANPEMYNEFRELKTRFKAWSENPTKYFGDQLNFAIGRCRAYGVIRIIMRPVTIEFALKTFRNL